MAQNGENGKKKGPIRKERPQNSVKWAKLTPPPNMVKLCGNEQTCCRKLPQNLGMCAKYAQNMRNVCFWPKKKKYAPNMRNMHKICIFPPASFQPTVEQNHLTTRAGRPMQGAIAILSHVVPDVHLLQEPHHLMHRLEVLLLLRRGQRHTAPRRTAADSNNNHRSAGPREMGRAKPGETGVVGHGRTLQKGEAPTMLGGSLSKWRGGGEGWHCSTHSRGGAGSKVLPHLPGVAP